MDLKTTAHTGIVGALALALVACSTPYQEMGLLGGVEAVQIDANSMRVSARGNALTDIGQMKDYVLLKAAEETLKHGYDLFEVADAENATRTAHLSTTSFHSKPVVAFGIANGQPVPAFGMVNYQTQEDSTYIKPGEDITIKMFKGAKPTDAPPNLYDAREVVAFLGPHVRHGEDAAVPASANTSLATADAKPPSPPVPVTPSPCTKPDAGLVKLAQAKGYQYRSNCPSN